MISCFLIPNSAMPCHRDAADKVVSGKAKFETLMAASQEIAASVAQLVVSSKVKATPTSANLSQLSKASVEVRGCTGTVVATVKDCAQMMEDRGKNSFPSEKALIFFFIFANFLFISLDIIIILVIEVMDFENLTLHQAKRLEMESQVRYFVRK